LSVCSGVIPPSKDFESYYKQFVESFIEHADDEIQTMAKYCIKCITKICKVGPQGRTLTTPEIELKWVLFFD
jgi:hypothetical protein